MNLSQSEVLNHHQHTTTRCMLESCHDPAQSGNLEQGARNTTGSVCGAPGLMACIHSSPCFLGFVSIVNNLTQHWCAWDHAASMCMSTPRTDWHVFICALVLSRVICLILWLLIFILLYCSVCVSICLSLSLSLYIYIYSMVIAQP